MASELRESLVGGLAVLGLVLGILVSYGGKGPGASAKGGGYLVSAMFNRIDGLTEGGEVHLGGIRVGTVERLSLDDRFRAVIHMRILPGVALPADTSAAIHTDGLFGAKFVVLEPGGEMDMLKNGDRIDFTQDAVIVSELLDLIISEGRSNLRRLRDAGP